MRYRGKAISDTLLSLKFSAESNSLFIMALPWL